MTTNPKRVAVLGGGSFGTAIGNIIAGNGHDVWLWMRNAERAEEINSEHENKAYLPGFPLNEKLHASTDLSRAVSDVDIVFVAVPSSSSRTVAAQIAPLIATDTVIVSTTKGIEAEGFKLMSQVLREELPGNPLGVMSGPNLAKEIAAHQLSATVIASDNKAVCKTIQDLLQCMYFRVYSSADMYGVEMGGALKNIYAIVCGLAAALDVGQNTMSMLITRSLAEMSRFAVHKGANPMTFLGLSGVGDLITTCTSPLSRNYRVGFALGKGQDLDKVIADMDQVAEGINTLKLVKGEADALEVYMPLASTLYDVLYDDKTVEQAIENLMLAEQPDELVFATQLDD